MFVYLFITHRRYQNNLKITFQCLFEIEKAWIKFRQANLRKLQLLFFKLQKYYKVKSPLTLDER